jgi:hypothetical protein
MERDDDMAETMTTGSSNGQWDNAVEILGLKGKTFFGGVENCDFTVAQLSILLDIGMTTLDFKFNYAPTVETFYEFGKRAEADGATVTYIGFLESNGRPDARVLIDGVKVTNFPDSMSLILDFAQSFHKADEFTANSEALRAWFD